MAALPGKSLTNVSHPHMGLMGQMSEEINFGKILALMNMVNAWL